MRTVFKKSDEILIAEGHTCLKRQGAPCEMASKHRARERFARQGMHPGRELRVVLIPPVIAHGVPIPCRGLGVSVSVVGEHFHSAVWLATKQEFAAGHSHSVPQLNQCAAGGYRLVRSDVAEAPFTAVAFRISLPPTAPGGARSNSPKLIWFAEFHSQTRYLFLLA